MDPCDKLRGILAALKAAGVKLWADLQSLKTIQGAIKHPVRAAPTPSVLLGVSNCRPYFGGVWVDWSLRVLTHQQVSQVGVYCGPTLWTNFQALERNLQYL